jgi:hypothetical protein
MDGFWFKHYCFLQMGNHYFNLNYDVNAPCVDLVPIQLIYHNEELNGFVWQHVAAMTGDRWETVDEFGVTSIVNNPPNCLVEFTYTPGVRTMHTYLRDWVETCIFE